MSDIEGLNLTASGSGKSEAEVAFEPVSYTHLTLPTIYSV